MPAAEYRKKADARIARYKERLEQHMTAQQLAEATRVAVRKKLATLEQQLRVLIDKRAGDGTITLAEATEVKQAGKTGREAIYREGITKLTAKDFRYASELGYAIKLLALAKSSDAGIQLGVYPALIAVDAPLATSDDFRCSDFAVRRAGRLR